MAQTATTPDEELTKAEELGGETYREEGFTYAEFDDTSFEVTNLIRDDDWMVSHKTTHTDALVLFK